MSGKKLKILRRCEVKGGVLVLGKILEKERYAKASYVTKIVACLMPKESGEAREFDSWSYAVEDFENRRGFINDEF